MYKAVFKRMLGGPRSQEVAIRVAATEVPWPALHGYLSSAAAMRHPHLVRLKGYCLEESALVYEYMAGGSLSSLLADRPDKLSWRARTRLALHVAQALEHLHGLQPQPVAHRCVGPGAFGLACLLAQEEEQASSRPQGLCSSGRMTPGLPRLGS